MLRDLGYERTEKIYYREHMRVLNTSLRIIFDDTSVDGMFKVMRERNLIQLYVEESPPISEYSSYMV